MILDIDESNERLSSPNNLLNKLKNLTGPKSKDSLNVFCPEPEKKDSIIPSIPNEKDIKAVLDDLDDELRDGLIKNTAKTVLGNSLVHLSKRLADVDNPTQFSRIAMDMSKIVNNLESAKNANPTNQNQVIIYRPIINNESHYQTVHVNE